MLSCIQALKKTISLLSDNEFVVHQLRVLPILIDLHTKNNLNNEMVLEMIQNITFGVKISIVEPFIETLIHSIVRTITSNESNVSFRKFDNIF